MPKNPAPWLLVHCSQCPSHLEPVRMEMYFRYDRACCYSPMFFPQEPNPIQTHTETRQGFLPSHRLDQAGLDVSSLSDPGLSLSLSAEKITNKRWQGGYFHGLPSSQSVLASPRASVGRKPTLGWSGQCSRLQFGGSVSGDGPFGSRIPSDGLTCSPRPTMLWLVDSDAPILHDSACLGEPFPDGF